MSHVTRIHDGQHPLPRHGGTYHVGHVVATIHHLKAKAPTDYMPKTLSRGNWVETYKLGMAPLDSECPKRLAKLDPNSLHQTEDNSGENELDLDQDTSG